MTGAAHRLCRWTWWLAGGVRRRFRLRPFSPRQGNNLHFEVVPCTKWSHGTWGWAGNPASLVALLPSFCYPKVILLTISALLFVYHLNNNSQKAVFPFLYRQAVFLVKLFTWQASVSSKLPSPSGILYEKVVFWVYPLAMLSFIRFLFPKGQSECGIR